MKPRHLVAGAALAAAALGLAPAVASAQDPEFPRNGVIPPGTYHVIRHPSNVIGSPLENCDLQVFVDGRTVVLVCPTFSRAGLQRPVGTDETYVSFDFVPIGLDLRDIDPRQGHWIGTINIADTPLAAPYPLAGVTLQRR
ncbi:hypothetical protein [Nocardia cyriacigeorgica]|uniref:Uncharacterized protein n=1 Tax=Nocardia cyriacigeorgica TaxID=135487 RepID=A0A4U8VTB3_9NOCA|nr:hypothetical protein [Nocardia cyriacigeorgica]VFA96482.1 Uncharacterised protein [Nocardia cyriacigeorgica]